MTSATIELLSVSGIDSLAISATAEAMAQRDALVLRAKRGTSVTNVVSAENAGAVLKDLKAFARSIEDARKIVKERPLKLCTDIDALAKRLTAEVDLEATRISRLLGTWQAEQNRIAEDARRRAWEEEQRIVREAEAKARKEAEIAAAVAAELAGKAARARSEEKAAEWNEKARQAEEKAAAASAAHVAATEQKIVETRVAAAAVAVTKPAGLATREDVCFEIEDIQKLYDAAPFLVSLQPNNAAIKSALKGLSIGQHLPGVRHWRQQTTIVR